MKIQHNGTTVKQMDIQDPHITFNEINEILDGIYQSGEVVKNIFVNGFDMTGHLDVDHLSNIGDIQSISIETVSPDVMMDSIYSDTIDYLKRIGQATDSISDLFYGEVDEEVWSLFAQLIEGVGFSIHSLQAIATHFKGLGGNTQFSNNIETFIQSLESHINEIHQAIQYRDMVVIGDIVKYELNNTVWEILETLTSKVNK